MQEELAREELSDTALSLQPLKVYAGAACGAGCEGYESDLCVCQSALSVSSTYKQV
jgi:hypothetical protein